jgi:hypothetical protein
MQGGSTILTSLRAVLESLVAAETSSAGSIRACRVAVASLSVKLPGELITAAPGDQAGGEHRRDDRIADRAEDSDQLRAPPGESRVIGPRKPEPELPERLRLEFPRSHCQPLTRPSDIRPN